MKFGLVPGSTRMSAGHDVMLVSSCTVVRIMKLVTIFPGVKRVSVPLRTVDVRARFCLYSVWKL